MLKKRYMLVLTLAFCLTATLFIAASVGYDPWLDHDEDGDVDTDDLYLLAGEYGSSGDPTKNVNVTNFPQTWNMNIVLQTLSVAFAEEEIIYGGTTYTQNLAGYRQVTLLMYATDDTFFDVYWVVGGVEARYMHLELYAGSKGRVETFAVQGENITIVVYPEYSQSIHSLGLYATN